MATTDLDKAISELFEAERRVRALHEKVSDGEPATVLDAIARAVKAALADEDEDESSMRLERLALLLGEQEGPRAVDLLIDVLAADHPEARAVAGEQLEGLAFDRFKEVAQGVERALERLPVGSAALPELPYVLAEVPEPGVAKLLELFLAHRDPDAVAGAIEVAVDIGDPSFAKKLEKLVGDERTVEIIDETDEPMEVTIGELVADALDIFRGADESFADEPRH